MVFFAARRLRAVSVAALFGLAGPSFAWVYPEHRDIAALYSTVVPAGGATVKLGPTYSLGLRMVFDWRYCN
jgi:hypothetical protein